MDLAPLGLAIHVCRAVFFILGVGKIIDHLAQGLRIGRRGIGLQVDLGDIEPVEAVLENLVQRIGIAGCEAAQLAFIETLDQRSFAASEDVLPAAVGQGYRTLKRIIYRGFYLSEIGATLELQYEQVPGDYRGCVPLAEIGRTWAT